MTETLIILGKLLASSALLLAFYWCVLRNHASYNLTRLYLLLLPLASLLMSGVNIPVYQAESSIVQHVAPAIAQSFEVATTTTEAPPTPTIAETQVPAINTSASAPSDRANTKVTLTTADYNRLLLFLWAAVSVTLLFIATGNLISLHIKSRRMVTQITPEGYALVQSAEVSSPCSFIRTIFMPTDIAENEANVIIRHEKAHIRHKHYIDVWVMEIMARLLWFNPFLWMARKELRNVHEFQADHDVLESGADVYFYQTLLLNQVMEGATIYANGFNHSFIRRRFVEMKHSTAGTLGKVGKLGLVAWMAALFCIFTFSECDTSANGKMTTDELKKALVSSQLDEPQMFVLDGYVDESITDSCYNIYLADDFLHIQGDTPVACVPVINKRFTYSIPLKRMTLGRVRCIFPGGELCSAWIDLFFVPGDTLNFTVHNGYYAPKVTPSYSQKVKAWAQDIRRKTNWQTPHMLQIEGKHWEQVECRRDPSGRYVKDVIFGTNETMVRVATDKYLTDTYLPNNIYLTDAAGNIYPFERGDENGFMDKSRRVFGACFTFKALPDTVTTFNLHIPSTHPMTGDKVDYVIRNIREVVSKSSDNKWYQGNANPQSLLYVDLGLSVLWATMNIGANKPEEYGDYFAWGETKPKDTYSITNYKHANPADSTLTKYCFNPEYGKVDSLLLLDECDDAATANWGKGWRMPTFSEWLELVSQCEWKWTEQNGVNGYLVTGLTGNSIFLPAAGCYAEHFHLNWPCELKDEGTQGYYWHGELDTHQQVSGWPGRGFANSYTLLSAEHKAFGAICRTSGLPVRAVHL